MYINNNNNILGYKNLWREKNSSIEKVRVVLIKIASNNLWFIRYYMNLMVKM